MHQGAIVWNHHALACQGISLMLSYSVPMHAPPLGYLIKRIHETHQPFAFYKAAWALILQEKP